MTARRDLIQKQPLRVGLIGTGFVAKFRADAFASDPRSEVCAIAGHRLDKAQEFAREHTISTVLDSEQALAQHPTVDLVVVCNINCDHGAAVRMALEAGKAVVVEYPLSLSVEDAAELIELAHQRHLFLHVEHIELLGGLHQAMTEHLPKVGTPRYARYCTAVPQNPAPQKWTYHADRFGFPLMGALSRVHRLTNLFGRVRRVSSQLQYDGLTTEDDRTFKNCRCITHLEFHTGLMAEVLYAKGEQTWRSQRWMEVEGDRGTLIFDKDQGRLLAEGGETEITVGSRRGLFAKDTTYVLDALYDGKPLYVAPEDSLYALQVAAAAAESARTGKTIEVA